MTHRAETGRPGARGRALAPSTLADRGGVGLPLGLAAPAVVAWAVAVLLIEVPCLARPASGWLAVVLAGVVAVLLRAAGAVSRRRSWTIAAAVLVAAAASLHRAGGFVHLLHTGTLAGLARSGAVLSLDVVLTGDPVHHAGGATRAGYVTAPATTLQVQQGERRQATRAPVLLVAGAGGAWSGLLPSQRLRLVGRLKPPRRGDVVAAVVGVRGDPRPVGFPSLLQRLAGRLRAGLQQATSGVPAPENGLLPAMLDGDTGRLDPAVSTDFRAAGLTHLTAVSGANIAILFAVVLGALRWLLVPRLVSVVLAGAALGMFDLVARPGPSVLRASVMAALGLVAMAVGRPPSTRTALCAGVLGLVLADPALAVAPGFALSVAATVGVLVVGPMLQPALGRWLPARLTPLAATAVGAQLACGPLLVLWWGQLSLAAVPANILAEPAVPVATLAAAAAAVLAPVLPMAAQAVAWAGFPAAWWLVSVAHVAARAPAANVWLPSGWPAAAAVTAVTAVAWLAARHRVLGRGAIVMLAGVAGPWAWDAVRGSAWPPPGWQLVACAAGSAPAVAVHVGPQAGLLVGVGNDAAALDGCLRPLGLRVLPLVVLTKDSTAAGLAVARLRHGHAVGLVVRPQGRGDSDDAAGAVPFSSGTRWRVGAAVVEVLAVDARTGAAWTRVQLSASCVDIPGDVDPRSLAPPVEGAGGADTGCAVVVAPHHGARALPAQYLSRLRARAVVVLVGRQPAQRASPAVLAELAGGGRQVFRADLAGDVAVVRRGGGIAVVTRGHPWVRLSALGAVRSPPEPAAAPPRRAMLHGWPT